MRDDFFPGMIKQRNRNTEREDGSLFRRDSEGLTAGFSAPPRRRGQTGKSDEAIMTIRKRLIFSHLAMFILPVLLTVFVIFSSLCGLIIYARSGNHVMAESGFQFNIISNAVRGILMDNVRNQRDWDDYDWIIQITDPVQTFIQVESEGKTLYRYGNESFRKDLEPVRGRVFLQGTKGRSDGIYSMTGSGKYLYIYRQTVRGVPYTISVAAHQPVQRSDASIERAVRHTVWFIVIAVILFTILISRFLSRRIIGSITRPLEELRRGAEEIRKGNLSVVLKEQEADEFTPAVRAFNVMTKKLAQSLKEREADEESRKELIASISHDIRTPLTAIKAYVEGLLDHVADTPEKQARYLQVIRRKTDVLDLMVEQLFLLTRLDLGEKAIPLERTSLGAVLRKTLEENRLSWETSGAELSAEIEGELPVHGNRLLFMRILENLVSNSIRYRTEEKVKIRIRAVQEKGRAVLTVTDDGPGVPEKALRRLQDIFYRTDRARSRTDSGSGLGLAIVSRSTALMKGRMSFANCSPHGLAVRIEFPLEEKYEEKDIDSGR